MLSVAALVAVTFVAWQLWPEPQIRLVPFNVVAPHSDAQPASVGLTARPRPAVRPAATLAAGATLRTQPGERRRAALDDGTVIYANQQTTLRYDGDHRLVLDAGEIFVEEPLQQSPVPLVVQTAQHSIIALSTRFAVRVTAAPALTVLQGQALVDGFSSLVAAGQECDLGTRTVAVARRGSHVFDWTRDLMTEAETPLVPASQFAGGALIAVDAQGQEAKLSLRKFHIDVHIEDGFARTTIDQTYFNHASWRLEGTFYFPLPPDASLSRLAMYVDGRLMEGGMAERDYARQVYERILTTQRDPALLEWVDGSTFKMRVFPLEGRQEKRIILSYVQRLPVLYGRAQYRFPAGHSLQTVGDWSFHARVKGGARLAASSPSHPKMQIQPEGNDLLLTAQERDARTDRDVAVHLLDSSAEQPTEDVVRFSSAEHEGAGYLMVRCRPVLASQAQRQRRDWVFLFESSGDRDPLLARVQVEVIRSLLTGAEPEDTFAILSAGTRVRPFAPEPRPVTPENVAAALAFLDQTHLIGALDLGRALTEATPLLKMAQNPCLVHVGSGIAALGERREDVLVKRLPDGVRYVGVGVGKRWGRSFMKHAADRSGGYVTQINPDEPIAWRAFELLSTLNTPRLLDVKVVDTAERAVFLTYATSIAQGEEVCAITRIAPGAPRPREVTISGTLDGAPYHRTVPVQHVAPGAGYLPRTWAKLEIDRLLAENAATHKERIVALSKAMYVMTPFTSLLVLENEAMYEQFKVDRGRKDHWALYPCPEKIPVVYEPDPNQPVDPNSPPKPPQGQVLQTILVRVPPRFFRWTDGVQQEPVLTAQQLLANAASLPTPSHNWVDFAEVTWKARTGQTPLQDSEFGPAILSKLPYVDRLYDETPRLRFLVDLSDAEEAGRRAVAFSLDGRQLVEALAENEGRPWAESDRKARHSLIVGYDVTRHKVIRRQVPVYPGHMITAGTAGADNLWHLDGEWGKLRGFDRSNEVFFTEFTSDIYMPEREEGLSQRIGGLERSRYRRARDLRRAFQHSPTFGPPVYRRPSFSGDERLFTDLVAYAPGMNTSGADIQAVLEAEATPVLATLPGRVDPVARRLIERARSGGWQTLTLPAAGDQSALTVTFDSSGRFAYERVLSLGLREQVVCDGRTLLHLYPDLGVGARRTVSRFHRADWARLVPWLLPPADDLTHGADLECVDERTVALVPRGVATAHERIHLVFAADGRLAERRLVAYPGGKIVAREVYDGAGGVRRLDGDDKELAARQLSLAAAPAPNLRPDTTAFVVLPLPLRSREYVYRKLNLDFNKGLSLPENACYLYLERDAALELFATEYAHANGPQARMVFLDCFHAHDIRPLGFYALLSAAGASSCNQPDFMQTLAAHRKDPLARYLALLGNPIYDHAQRYWGLNAADRLEPRDSLFARLAALRDRWLRWNSNALALLHEPSRRAEQQRSLEFLRQHRSTVFGWALLTALQDRAAESDKPWQRDLAETWKLFAGDHALGYVADYERARCLLLGDRRDEARTVFRELYARTLKEGVLPPLDGRCREALLGSGKDTDLWDGLVNTATFRLVTDGHRVAAVVLAWQCWQLGDQPLAANVLDRALDGLPADKDRLPVTLAAVEYLARTNQVAAADDLLQMLLSDEEIAKQPWLWRLGAHLAEQRGMTVQVGSRLERALALEYEHLPQTIDLQALRTDYGRLLEHFYSLAAAGAALQTGTPSDLMARTVRAADHWRALDRDPAAPCQAAARVLRALGADASPIGAVAPSGPGAAQTLSAGGAHDLAWEYLTTAYGAKPKEEQAWLGLAQTLSREGDLTLADRAYLVASEADPGNAQILWDRARNLRQAGDGVEARQLLQQIVDGKWEPRFEALRTQARRQLEMRP
jgi:predicted Zn-dependent protease